MNDAIECLADGTLIFLPERLNRDPAVLRGLTNDEMWLAGFGAVLGILLGVPLAIATASIAVAPTSMIAGMALVLVHSCVGPNGPARNWLARKLEWIWRPLASRARGLILRPDLGRYAVPDVCAYLPCHGGNHEPLSEQGRCATSLHIVSLRLAVVILALICTGLWYGWRSAPTDLTVHVPPDLPRSGSTRKWWDVPRRSSSMPSPYTSSCAQPLAFGWRTGLSPRHLWAAVLPDTRLQGLFLDGDYEYRKAAGELRQRVRGVYEVLGRGYGEDPALRVKQLDRDSWLVQLDLNADEYYAAEPVKRVVVRYPARSAF